MKKLIISAMTLLAMAGSPLFAQSGPEDVIPAPASYELTDGTSTCAKIRQRISKSFLKELEGKDLSDWQKESAYSLEISENGVSIKAASETGAFYAMKTLEMMLAESPEVKCCRILDWPRFQYRGLMLDVSRHFQPKSIVLKELDMMSKVKLNRFHFHLVDQPGWRIQIDKYPLLTQYSAWRTDDEWQDWWKDKQFCYWNDPRAYGGYYTKDDIREIVEYAAERHIEVIPEIEMPAHSIEVIAAYPELTCNVDGKPVVENADVLCASSEKVYTFLEDVLSEVFELFPSKYVHIGGDEADRSQWSKCPQCQALMKKEGIESVEKLQSYLTKRIEKFCNDHGRAIIGWDEILEGELAPNATVMSWRGTDGGLKAIAAGHDVIMSPTTYYYLDYHQGKDTYRAVGPYLPLEKSYSYDPGAGIPADQFAHILGVQGNMWTEWVRTWQHLEYEIYPRIFAVAETGWSPQSQKDYDSFRKRVMAWENVMRDLGYNFYDLAKEVKE
jgi:hexosaminidase